jgi:phage baseplate assembly protein W
VATINFKNVGEVEASVSTFVEDVIPTPIGFQTPLRLGNTTLFVMYTDIRRVLNDNFKNLLMTNHGERVALYDFGANLTDLVFGGGNLSEDQFDAEAVIRIKTATSKYMPFISLRTFESRIDHSDNKVIGKTNLQIVYDIPRLGITDQVQSITFYLGA